MSAANVISLFHRENIKQRLWNCLWVSLSAILLVTALSNKVPDNKKILFSDQSTHLMAAISIWVDFDLRYTLNDLKRFRALFPNEEGPRGLFIKQNLIGNIYYAKPFLYAGFSAPFFGLFGTSGFVICNFVLISIIGVFTVRSISGYFGRYQARYLGMAFVFLSPFLAWVSIPHPDIFIAALLMLGGYLVISSQKLILQSIGALLLGLCLFEKPTFAVVVPWIVLFSTSLDRRARLCIISVVLAGWCVPTLMNYAQDGSIFSYQGKRFAVSHSPFPLEPGWTPPPTGVTAHVFNIQNLASALVGNIGLLPEKLKDFLVGRQTGISLYFPVGLLFLLVLLSRINDSWPIILGFFSYLGVNWLAFPTNGFGGQGSYGSRYLMQILPLLALGFLIRNERKRNAAASSSKVATVTGIAFVVVAIALQFKVLPPSERLVMNPSGFLMSYPAKMFSFESSLLPTIPVYGDGFQEDAWNQSAKMFRVEGFTHGIVEMTEKVAEARLVVYRDNNKGDVPGVELVSTAPISVRWTSSGAIISEQYLNPGEPAVAKLKPSIFGPAYFDVLLRGFVRWASIRVNLIRHERVGEGVPIVGIAFSRPFPPVAVKFGKSITVREFPENGIQKRFGWSQDEAWGVWSDGVYADLAIPIRGGTGKDLEIFFDLHPYVVPEHPSQEVAVLLNGKLADRWRLVGSSGGSRRAVKLDKSLISRGMVNVGFRFMNPGSPSALGHGSDKRRLGIGLRALRIEELH